MSEQFSPIMTVLKSRGWHITKGTPNGTMASKVCSGFEYCSTSDLIGKEVKLFHKTTLLAGTAKIVHNYKARCEGYLPSGELARIESTVLVRLKDSAEKNSDVMEARAMLVLKTWNEMVKIDRIQKIG